MPMDFKDWLWVAVGVAFILIVFAFLGYMVIRPSGFLAVGNRGVSASAGVVAAGGVK